MKIESSYGYTTPEQTLMGTDGQYLKQQREVLRAPI